MKIFGIAGFRNSGKTTLMVDLVRELTARGLRVGTVKHAHHEFDIDIPGKDSYLHREAGASEVIVASDRRWAHIREMDNHREPTLADLLRHFEDVDLVLLEGYKGCDHPKLLVTRAGAGLPEVDAAVKALVSDETVEAGTATFLPREDVTAIADFILQNAVGIQS